jgi:hypothetical protein
LRTVRHAIAFRSSSGTGSLKDRIATALIRSALVGARRITVTTPATG